MAAALGYLAGSLPTAYVVTRLAGDTGRDLRTAGTRNPGAWNAAKVLGLKWGALLLTLDVGLGIVASGAGRWIAGDNGAYAGGTAAVVGHCFPAWHGFRGGKAVATSIGTKLVCFPVYVPVDLALTSLILLASRGRGDMATYLASVSFVGTALLWTLKRRGNAWGPRPGVGLPLYAALTSAAIAYRFAAAPPAAPAAVAPRGETAPAPGS